MLEKIISGGQTGVDRAGLDVAIKLGIKHGGWCPKGRLAEDGTIAYHYNLCETSTYDYSERTKLNIRDSDGTLILLLGDCLKFSPGTILTIEECKLHNKPILIINLLTTENNLIIQTINWIKINNIKVLNIAGPRHSQSSGIYVLSLKFINLFLLKLSKIHFD